MGNDKYTTITIKPKVLKTTTAKNQDKIVSIYIHCFQQFDQKDEYNKYYILQSLEKFYNMDDIFKKQVL